MPVRGVSLCPCWSLFGDDIEKLLGLGTSSTPAPGTALRLPPCDTAPAQDEEAAQGEEERSSDGRAGLLEQDPATLACSGAYFVGPVDVGEHDGDCNLWPTSSHTKTSRVREREVKGINVLCDQQ